MRIKIWDLEIEYNSSNIKLIDSYKIKNKSDMRAILSTFKLNTGYKSKRSIRSWLREWRFHNRLYRLGLFKSHTKDCDLEENEKIHRRIIYFIFGRF